jgi:hypothetical protein
MGLPDKTIDTGPMPVRADLVLISYHCAQEPSAVGTFVLGVDGRGSGASRAVSLGLGATL